MVADFASSGRVHRRLSSKHDRVAHLLSDIEEDVFLSFEGSVDVLEVREQFALPRDATLSIADELGIRHPTADGVPVVMTTDLMVFLTNLRRMAVSVKSASELTSRRALEKLEIERQFWTRQNVPWHLITDKEMSRAERVHHQQTAPWLVLNGLEQGADYWDRQAAVALPQLKRALKASPATRVIDFVRRLEASHGWPAGDGLSALRRLVAVGLLAFDHSRRFDPFRPLGQLTLPEPR
jgi:hypothetical protein